MKVWKNEHKLVWQKCLFLIFHLVNRLTTPQI